MTTIHLRHGDCVEVLKGMKDGSVGAVLSDPPYGLEFMGKEWDGADGFRRTLNAADVSRDNAFGRSSRTSPEYRAGHLFQEWCEAWAREALRVLKPGGHLLAFGGTRTSHRLACAVEDAGFEIRDSLIWQYGSGFPKSLDVSKAIDKIDRSEASEARARTFTAWMRSTGITARQVDDATGTCMGNHYTTHPTQPAVATADLFDLLRPLLPPVPDKIEELVRSRTVESENMKRRAVVGHRDMGFSPGTNEVFGKFSGDTRITAPHTDDAKAWEGWGTALKPAWEPVVVGRKP